MEYKELENNITNSDDSYFVVRDTNHPIEDLKRNWSAACGGVNPYNGDFAYVSLEEAIEADKKWNESDKPQHEYRFHPAHDGWCMVHYEGLGAYQLEAETLEEALKEADEYEENLACTSECGDGHFLAHQVVSFHKAHYCPRTLC